MALGGVPAHVDELVGGFVEEAPQGGDGGFCQVGVAVGVAGEHLEGGVDDDFLAGPERHRQGADLLGADQAADQGGPAGEDDLGPFLRLGGVEVFPAEFEGAELERVDPGGEALADRDRGDPDRPAQRFVLVLDVAEDERFVAEAEHAQQERLDGGRLAHSGFAEGDHVRVRHRDRLVEDPAIRVDVEAAPRQVVDADLGAAGRDRRAGHERPQHRRLVRGHPPHRHRRRGGRPAPVRPARPVARCRREQARFAFDSRGGGHGREGVAEVGQEPAHSPAVQA